MSPRLRVSVSVKTNHSMIQQRPKRKKKIPSRQAIAGLRERAVDSACPQVWIPELEVGLGLWQGESRGIERQWLRWYDAQGNWLLTDTEEERQRAEQAEALLAKERQRAEQERQQLLERLRARGINPDELLG